MAETSLSIPLKGLVTELGMKLPDDLSYEEWLGTMGKLFRLERATRWLIGDGLAFGEQKYGERYAQAMALSEATGINLSSLQQAQWVAEHVPTEVRRANLSWSHHREVAAQEPEVQDRLLARAEEEEWNVREIQDAVRTYKRALEKPEEYPDEDEAEPEAEAPNLPRGRLSEEYEEGEIVPVKPGEAPAPASATEGMTPEEIEKWGRPEDVQPDDYDPVKELEEVTRDNLALEAELESLTTTDDKAEIRKLNARIRGLEGQVRSEMAAKNDAIKLTKYYRRLVDNIKGALGVEENKEIQGALLELLQRS